jgi:hypothetical protein
MEGQTGIVIPRNPVCPIDAGAQPVGGLTRRSVLRPTRRVHDPTWHNPARSPVSPIPPPDSPGWNWRRSAGWCWVGGSQSFGTPSLFLGVHFSFAPVGKTRWTRTRISQALLLATPSRDGRGSFRLHSFHYSSGSRSPSLRSSRLAGPGQQN